MPSLEFQCPLCGEKGDYEVVQTEPGHYRWSVEKTPFFERIAGKDIFFRKRRKFCWQCQKDFKTIEMSEIYLHALLEEIDRLENNSRSLKTKIRSLAETLLIHAE